MKNIILLVGLFLSVNLISQNKGVTTATIAVRGNCEQCKERIENAADIKGVKVCTWDEKSQAVTVTFNSEKVTLDKIREAIAKSGHDAEGVKSSDSNYQKLPGCCKYRDRACEEKK